MNMLRQPYLDELDSSGGITEQTETPEPTPDPTPTPDVEQRIKVKYNHEELELPYEEAVAHIQKGMNYEKAVERAKQEAKDEYIAEQYAGQLWKGKPITTQSELKQALKEQEAEESFREKYSHLDEDVIQELLAGKQFREKFEQKENETLKEQQERQRQEKEQAEQYQDQQEFLKMFKDENTRAWEETDSLPPEVIESLKQGKNLADSYTKYLASSYKQKLTAQEVNTKNANSSTGSVTGNGNGKDSTLTQEMIDNMTPKELANRWSEVKTLFKMK